MNNLEKYLDQVIEQKAVDVEPLEDDTSGQSSNIMTALMKRWYIIILTFIINLSVLKLFIMMSSFNMVLLQSAKMREAGGLRGKNILLKMGIF